MGINLLLVDDHRILREGLKQLLEFEEDLFVSGQASTALEAKELLVNNKFDVILLDINLPDESGINLLRDIKASNISSKVLMLTLHNEVDYLIQAMDVGADGYILKDSGSGELVTAIRKVFAGERYIEPSLIPSLNAKLLQRETLNSKLKVLTKREEQILISISEGKSNKDIADSYDISERTVKNHITSLFKKIGVSDRTQAAVYAIRNNIVKP